MARYSQPLLNNAFDWTILNHSIELLATPARTVEEVHRIGAPKYRVDISALYLTSLNIDVNLSHRHFYPRTPSTTLVDS
jgi:hypothetical protein